MKRNFSFYPYSTPNTPEFIEKDESARPYIAQGEDNLYPHYLDQLYVGSAIHSAIIKGVADMIYGLGLHSPLQDQHVEPYLKAKSLFGDGTCLKRMAFDLKLYGQCYLNVIYSEDRSKIAEVYHLSAATVRSGKKDDEGVVRTYYCSDNWTDSYKAEFQPQAVASFSTEDRTAASQILHIKSYSPISEYYGIPDYIGSTRYIELDRQISDFHLANVSHGLFPSMIISFNNGIPTDEERQEIERLLYDKFSGASNAGKFLMTFNDSQENAPTIESFQATDPQNVYSFMSNEISSKILSGHRVTSPLLFGLREEGGGFGSNADEMRDAYDLFYQTVVKPQQELLLSGIQPLFSVNGIALPFELGKLMPASFLEDKTQSSPTPFHFNGRPEKISPEQTKVWLSHLEYSHDQAPPGYKLLRSDIVEDTTLDHRIHARRNFAESKGTLESYADPESFSPWGDVVSPGGVKFALRYQYSQLDSTKVSKTGISRDFCQKMVALSENGTMYRYEDIADMSNDGINGQFAAAGTSTYDIFEWIGGKNCYHAWKRLIFASQDDDMSWEDIESEWDAVMKRVGNNPYVPQKGTESVPPIEKQ